MTLFTLQNEYALEMQQAWSETLSGKKSIGDMLDIFRRGMKRVAEEAVKSTTLTEPTAYERRNTPNWATTIDLQIEKQKSGGERFLTGF